MNNQIKLGNRIISRVGMPYIIAEIGVNHEGSLDLAKELILQAKYGGADAAKFQSYKADTLASKLSPAYWDLQKESTKTQHELFRKFDSFGVKDYENLASFCEANAIDFISTPFDYESVDFLDALMPFYKVASADINNVPFLRRIAKKGKPVVLSTGASTLGEIDRAISELENSGSGSIALLHCILNYPTSNENAHLRMIDGLQHAYPNYLIGYSDHTIPDADMSALVTAHLLGASIIEKHFTIDKTKKGNDHYHAMDQKDLANFIASLKKIHQLLGSESLKMPLPTEAPAIKNARRSIVLSRNLESGEKIAENDIVCKRPGSGISPVFWDQVLGKTVTKSLPFDHILQWSELGE